MNIIALATADTIAPPRGVSAVSALPTDLTLTYERSILCVASRLIWPIHSAVRTPVFKIRIEGDKAHDYDQKQKDEQSLHEGQYK